MGNRPSTEIEIGNNKEFNRRYNVRTSSFCRDISMILQNHALMNFIIEQYSHDFQL